jgi:hypothetical protein
MRGQEWQLRLVTDGQGPAVNIGNESGWAGDLHAKRIDILEFPHCFQGQPSTSYPTRIVADTIFF